MHARHLVAEQIVSLLAEVVPSLAILIDVLVVTSNQASLARLEPALLIWLQMWLKY